MKLDLLTNATVVDDAIRFISGKSKEKIGSFPYNNNGNDEVSNETDYEGEHLQEEESGETTDTRNQVF